MPHLAEAPRAVYRCGFVELLVDTGNSRDVDYRAPAEAFPEVPRQHFEPDVVAAHQEVYAFAGYPGIDKECIDEALSGEQCECERINEHPAYEVRYGSHGLDNAADVIVAYLRKEYRERHRQP